MILKEIFVKLFILSILSVNSCSDKGKQKEVVASTDDTIVSQQDLFLAKSKPINYIKGIEKGNRKKFIISFDTSKHILQDGFTLYKMNVTDRSDSLYLGLKEDVVYTYDGTKHYLDKTFILNSKNKNYYSFFCGNDYRVDSLSVDVVNVNKEDVYTFYMSKLTDQQGDDYFYYEGKSPKETFRKIVFSKSKGVISAELYDREKKEIYVTTD
ncbi:hypothetical protein ACG2LH_16065 [Zhouia sp. PK063]|uniref:hypothetical protein n=1 Tax=Zhouia sp. PK063 TaxID=3373602 RepID=UPI0037B90A9C